MDQVQIAKRTVLIAAGDRYCPIWELVDEIAQECDVTRDEAVLILSELRADLVADEQLSFWTSSEPYGDPRPIAASTFFADGLGSHSRISDGAPYYYIDFRRPTQ